MSNVEGPTSAAPRPRGGDARRASSVAIGHQQREAAARTPGSRVASERGVGCAIVGRRGTCSDALDSRAPFNAPPRDTPVRRPRRDRRALGKRRNTKTTSRGQHQRARPRAAGPRTARAAARRPRAPRPHRRAPEPPARCRWRRATWAQRRSRPTQSAPTPARTDPRAEDAETRAAPPARLLWRASSIITAVPPVRVLIARRCKRRAWRSTDRGVDGEHSGLLCRPREPGERARARDACPGIPRSPKLTSLASGRQTSRSSGPCDKSGGVATRRRPTIAHGRRTATASSLCPWKS